MLGIAARSPSNGQGTLWFHTPTDGWLKWIFDNYIKSPCCSSYSNLYDYQPGSNYATAGG